MKKMEPQDKQQSETHRESLTTLWAAVETKNGYHILTENYNPAREI